MRHFSFLFLIIGLVFTGVCTAAPQLTQPLSQVGGNPKKQSVDNADGSGVASKTLVQPSPAELQLAFTLNQGQWPEEVIAMADGAGYRIWVTLGGLRYDFMKFSSVDSSLTGHVVEMDFNSTHAGPVSVKNERNGVVNYYNGSDPRQWYENVPQFGEVNLADVYDGISLRVYGENGLPRYDFIVEPGADVSQISLSVNGVENLHLDPNGDLSYLTALGEVKQTGLFTYQLVDGEKREIASAFSFDKKGTLGFEVGEYDPALPLVIDPLVYSTFIGPASNPFPGYLGNMEVENGFVYLTGYVPDLGYPTTIGAYNTDLEGAKAYITKLDQTGSELIYSTFIGGGLSTITNMVVEDGYVYLTGSAGPGLPTTSNAYQMDFASGGKLVDLVDSEMGDPLYDLEIPLFGGLINFTDAFVTKLSKNGGGLVYSTYIGGAGVEIGNGIAVENGFVYLTGFAGPQKENKVPFPTSANAYQKSNGAGFLGNEIEDAALSFYYSYLSDVFVSKLSQNGSELVYSTLIGQEMGDVGIDLVVDQGKAIVAGTSNGSFPGSLNSLETTPLGNNDLILLRLNGDASVLEYSARIGTAEDEAVTKIARDGADIYLLGTTDSPVDFTVTPGAFQDSEASIQAPFLMRFGNLGEELVFSTFVGSLQGNASEHVTDLAVDKGIPYLTGYTSNPGFLTTENAFKKSYGEESLSQGFVMQFTPNGESLSYSTLLGGFLSQALAIEVENDLVYLTGIAANLGIADVGDYKYPITEGVYNDGSTVEKDAIEVLTFVTVFDFELDKYRLGPPALISPSDGLKESPLRPEFSWEPAINDEIETVADQYELQFSLDPDFSSVLRSQYAPPSGTVQSSIILEYGTKYYWRVRGQNTQGLGVWSEIYSFVTIPSENGEGSLENPWEIASPEQLNAVRTYLDGHFKVVVNIDLEEVTGTSGKYWNGGAGWNPIGDSANPFRGTIEGQGFEIGNVFIHRPEEENLGVFGVVDQGTIRRVALIKPVITGASNVGGLAGLWRGGDLRENYVLGGSISGKNQIGGLVGRMQGGSSLFENSYSVTDVAGEEAVGGLVGEVVEGTFMNSYALNTASGVSEVGAIIGSGYTEAIDSYYNSETSGPGNGLGLPLVSAEMRLRLSFENWDFDTVWKIAENRSFPVLIYNEQIPAPGQIPVQPGSDNILYVDQSVTGGLGNGSSWENALADLTSAWDWAIGNWIAKEGPLKIYVAQGIYYPTDGTDVTKTFQMMDHLEVYGGFPGGGSTFESRNWEENQTVLSGDIVNRDPEIVTNIDFYPLGNTNHVVTASNTEQSAVLNGFYINAGFAWGDGDANNGGGVFNSGGSPVLSDLIVIGNKSGGYGGGMANSDGANPLVSNVVFQGNYGTGGGGGMSNLASDPVVGNVKFIGNITAINGGGLYNSSGSSPQLLDVDFVGNLSRGGSGTGIVGGGGMYSAGGSPVLTNVRFSGNMALRNNARGGAVLNNSSKTILTNVTITGNTAYYGGGIYLTQSNNQPEIRNSVIWNNKDNTGIGTANSSLVFQGSSGPEITYSLIQGHVSGGGGNLDGTIADNDPGFVDPIVTFGVAPILTGDFRPQPGSPVKSKGNQAYFDSGLVPDLGAVESDLDGNKRFIGGLEMGAYEIQEELEEIIISVIPGQSKSYGTADPDEFLYESSNLTVSFTGSLGRVPGEDVGTYRITQGSLSAGDGFTLDLQEQLFGITKVNLEGISLESRSFVYDGNPQSLTIVGELPEGATVELENNTRTEVGNQVVSASINAPNYTPLLLYGDLEITPADLTGISFESGSFEFDGTAKTLQISGTLAEGTTVVYSNNGRRDVGVQEVTATISGNNYKTLVLKADLIITPEEFEVKVSKSDPSAFGVSDGEIALLVKGGVKPYTYSWTPNIGNTFRVNDLPAGLYDYLVTDAEGQELQATVELINTPAPGFTVQSDFVSYPLDNCSVPHLVTFSDRSQNADTWRWDFGDGTIVSSSFGFSPKNPTHTYTEAGEYAVSLYIQDTIFGYSSTSTKIIKIRDVKAEFTSNTSFGCGPLSVQFTDQSSDASRWEWDFGDGNSSTEQNPLHTFEPGSYTVKLTVFSENGCEETVVKTNYIQVIGPKVDFATDITAGCGPLTVSFTNNTFSGSPIIGWLWDFGDGATSTQQNPTHEYASAGTYTVKLTVNDLDGCSRTLTKTDLIQVNVLEASLVPTSVTCNGGSDGSLTATPDEGLAPFTYQWNNGASTATISGLSAGNYSVIITDAKGCSVTKSVELTEPMPAVLATSNPTSISHSGAELGGELLGGLDCAQETGVVYATTSNPAISDSKVIMTLTGSLFNEVVTGLQVNTTYYARAYSTNQNGITNYGNEVVFTTSKKTLEITATPGQSKIYGEADPVLLYEASGFEGGDDESILTGALERGAGENVGFYAIQLGTLDAGANYTIDFTSADFEIIPADIAGITFDDGSFVFDGTAKSLAITGTLPDGTSVAYTDNSRTDVGSQEVTATISGSNYTTLVLTADLTVTPADITGITFDDGSFVFDGTTKSLAITGTLPDGASVAYTNNSRTDVGTQEVTATITGPNFTTVVLTADLTVTPAGITGITFGDGSFVYDGTAKSLAISGTLPDGTSVAYTDNSRTDVGTQEATATITGPNFTTLVLTADLTVTPADITGITFDDGSFVFDGTAKSLAITGTLPDGTSVAYTNNSRTDVGSQEVTATITGSNYKTLVLTADLTVTPAEITGITFDDGSFVFDGTAKSLAISGTLPDGTSVNYTDNSRTDVGTQEATATITGPNFTTLVLTADLTVTPAEITGITFDDGSFVFDGTAKSLAIEGPLPTGTSVNYTDNSRTDVGSQEVTATITGDNFTTLVLTADLTVTPADITGITFDDGSFVFDGTAKSLAITGTLPDGTSVAYTDNSRTDVGTQEVTATITGSNYNTLVLTADLTVTPAEITGITFDDGSFVFDGTAKSLAISGTLPDGTSVNYTDNSRTDVGSQEVTATITGSNYNTLVLTADLTVIPADITGITFGDGSFVFDGTAKSLAISGTLPDGTSVAYANNSRTDVGTQEVTATITGPNFTTLVLTADLSVTPAEITGITFDDGSFVFDGTAKSLAISGTLPDGTSVAYTNNSRTDVGTQEVTATITGSNYNTLVLTADLTVTPAGITGITFDDGSFVFDGTAKSLAITGTLPDGTSVAYTDNSRRDVGTQEVTATITGSNYNTLVLTADLSVTPATVTGITFENGSFVYDGTAKSLAITGALPTGTSVNYGNNSRTDVGTQEVTATITGDNYTTLVLTADLTITPADVSGITFDDGSFVFDGTAKSLAIAGTLPDGTSVSYTNNSRTDVGTQEVTATITGSNYTTLVLTADLTVTPADITGITFDDGSFVYDGTAKSLEISGTLPEGASVAYTNNSRTDVGTQEATATISGSNFTTLVLTADLTVTPADIAGITFDDASFVFDGTAKSLAITGTLPDGTSVSYNNNSRTDVGTQEVTATISGSNYNTLVLTADLTVTPADITGITFDDGSFVFDGAAKSLAITGTLPDGTSVAYTDNSRTDVGTQEVTATITGTNFTTLVLTADLSVTPATVTGITFDDGSFVYDGTAKSLAITGTLPDGTSVAYTDNSRTDVGTQEVTATITGTNFTTLVLTADLMVTPADVTGITFGDGSFVFDGTAKSLAITGTLPDGTSVAYANNSRTDVGTQEVTATISGSNYNTLVLTADLIVTPADVSGITFGDGSFVFDGAAKSLAITGTLPDGTSVAYTDNSRTDVGSQEVTATISGSNYNTLVLIADLTVTPADVSGITFDDDSFVYDGTAKSLAITGTLPDGTSVAYTDNSRTDVGSQEVTATITGSNYNTLVLTADLTVTPATVTGITFENGSFVFDGTAKSLAITGILPDGTSVAYTNNSRTDVGTQEVTATITGTNFTTLVLTADLSVTPATVTGITFENGSFVFDGTAKSLAITGTLPDGTSVAYANNSRTDVGTQEVTATITGSNYNTLVLTADLTVTPAEITGITFDDGSFVYDGTAKSLAITGTLPDGTSVSYNNNSRTDVGTQEVTATITGTNFTTLVLTADLSVTPATVTGITFENGSFVYDGTAKSLAIEGILPTGTSVNYGHNSRTDVGTQEVTATITGSNYITLVVTADLTVTPAEIMGIAFDDASFVYDGTAKALAIEGELPKGTTIAYSNNGRTDVGSQEVTATISGSNLDELMLTAELIITPGDLRVAVDPGQSKVFGETDPELTYTVSGFGMGDNEGGLEGSPERTPGEEVGTYVIGIGTLAAGSNYTIVFTGAEFEIHMGEVEEGDTLTGFVDQSLEAVWGTEAAELKVPTEVVAITAQGAFINLPVVWDLTGYEPTVSASSVYTGSAVISPGLFNPSGLQPSLEITVLSKPAPEDVTLSQNSFVAVPDQFFQEIGAFTVIDPTDDEHTLSLPEGIQDNQYFEVLDGILFWSSAEQAEGRTDFTIVLKVTDRAGNVLEKNFSIIRERTPLEQLEVANTFTPNGDGINDTWGMPALRYYSGVRISVFAVGGERMFYTENPDVRWDGVFNGKEMPVGAYLYIIEVGETGEVRRGMLNLLQE